MKYRISLSLVFVLIFSVSVFSQDTAVDPETEKLRIERRTKLIENLLRDTAELRLPENRAFTSAKLGSLLWKTDPEKAMTLFRNAVTDLIAAQAAAEAGKGSNNQFYDLLSSQSLRPSILSSIASADAELALDSLYRSRPLAVQRALAQGGRRKINNSSIGNLHLAQQEVTLEQRLIRMVAEQKPERSVALLKESIKKNLSGETLALLKKVWSKDPAAGNELANEVVNRLVSSPFFGADNQVNYDLITLSNAILGEYVRERNPDEKYIAFVESGMRALANKLISTYIERAGALGYVPLGQLEPVAKRFSPSSYEQLKKAAANTRGLGHHVTVDFPEAYTKLMSGNPTAETLISEAKTFPIETRRSVYSHAANKLSDAGHYQRAVALLNEHFEDEALEHAISSLNWYHAHHLINRDEYDAAEAMIMEFNESNRISGLTSLATKIYSKNPKENLARASGILQRARTFLPETPETGNELSQLLQLIASMATIDSSEAFRNLEPVIDQVNRLTEAWAVVNRFQGGNIRQGEYIMANGLNFGIYLDPGIFKTLAQKDFERTMQLIDRFERREMRIIVVTGLLESGF